jgi:son of sevenless
VCNVLYSHLSLLDTNFVSDFLLTFRSFTTPRELLSLLEKRFRAPMAVPKAKLTKEDQEKIAIVRLRVCNFIRLWIEINPKDFTQDEEFRKRILKFSAEMSSVLPGPDQIKKKVN